MPAGSCTGGAAAGKGFLNGICTAYHVMCLKKLYGNKRYFTYSLDVFLVAPQQIAKIMVHNIIVILVAEHFERYLFKFFFTSYRKYGSGVHQRNNLFAKV
ncbi:hypothetical protein VF13_37755 [Nostoc linckia z16]|nr:hypothetical protein VF13_37755 [Nostoc linckia z16]